MWGGGVDTSEADGGVDGTDDADDADDADGAALASRRFGASAALATALARELPPIPISDCTERKPDTLLTA
jgi:hypothetical protein